MTIPRFVKIPSTNFEVPLCKFLAHLCKLPTLIYEFFALSDLFAKSDSSNN